MDMKIFIPTLPFSFMKYFILFTFLCFNTFAADDTFLVGDGHNGALTVNISTTVNTYTKLTAAAASGQNVVSISNSTGFANNDLVMVWQTSQATTGTTSSSSASTNLSSQPVGHWEFARIQILGSTKLTFSTPLRYAYSAPGAQVIRVPEYSAVTINSGASIVAQPWNGETGGIVAFLANATVTINGTIDANGSGFRGGVYNNATVVTTGGSDLDIAPPAAGQKGEGLFVNRYSAAYGGRGSFTNGGGGGSGYKSGGGGGGHFGNGGVGGNSDLALDENRSVGGYGGGTIQYEPTIRLVMGGGGGAGQGSSNTGAAGGAGGGIVFIRANTLVGTGSISANGASAQNVTNDAGSGGGAGGSVYLRLIGNAACISISANGGNGGSVTASEFGPGGGGSGGRILFQSGGGTCSGSSWTVTGGISGIQGNSTAPGGPAYGATDGTVGGVVTLTGGMTAPVVAITSPASGATTTDKPSISGTATPTSSVRLIIDGTTTYSASADGDGDYSYTLSGAQALSNGTHTLAAIADYQGLSSSRSEISFTTDAALPVRIISFDSKSEQRIVHLTWKVTNEENVDNYILERSSDGKNFKEIKRVPATAPDFTQTTYTTTDDAPLHGMNLYRLKVVDNDASFAYSKLISQRIDGGSSIIYPNPTTENATLSIDGLRNYGGTVSVINSLGKVVQHYQVPVGANNSHLQIERKQLPAGVYFVSIYYPNGEKLSATKLVFY